MTPERWQRLTDLFESALEHAPTERAAFLASACADDPALREEVHAVLDSHDRAGSFGDSPAFNFATSSDGRLAAGSCLGRYEIVTLIGAGGMGEVYRARDPQLGREVGVKILRPREVASDQLERFEREARAVGALNHSNILAVYDIGTEADVPYVVSELLEGETLRTCINRGSLSLPQSLDIALQIVAGLTAAHEKGIVHGDLKPENLFITSDGLVKILDFGLATHIGATAASQAAASSSATEQGPVSVLGTAGYMSPEQVRGHHADVASDVFAFGAVLYEMLTGRRAFSGDSVVETMGAVLTKEPPAISTTRPELPGALDLIVHRCVEKNPDRRFQSTRALGAALEAVRRSATFVPRPNRPMWLAWSAAVLGVAAVVAALVFLGGRQGPPGPGASGRPSLAVGRFDDHTGDPKLAWLSDGLPRMLVTSLAQTPGLDMIGSERLGEALKELGRVASDRRASGEVARRAGAGAVLVGSLFTVGHDIRIDVTLEDLRTGRVLAATSEQGPDVFALVDTLTAEIRVALDLKDRPAGRPLREVTTTSLSAYELFVKGLDAWHNHRWADARTLFEEAVRIDPAFALAHGQLALVLERLGEGVKALAHRRTVMGQLDRLPERQRLLAEATGEYETNPARSLQLMERMLERYPDEEEAYDLIVHIYTFTQDPAYWKQTLAFMQRWARAIPGPGSGHFHNHYGYALFANGLYADAEKEFRAYIRVVPNEANPYDSLAELFLLTGRPEQAIEQYDQALQINPLFGTSHVGRAYAAAMLGRYDNAVASVARLQAIGPRAGISAATIHLVNALVLSRVGRYREAQQHISTGVRLTRELGDAATEADFHLLEAILALERRELPRAVEAVRRADGAAAKASGEVLARRRSSVAHLIGGAAEAQAGHVGAAQAHLTALRSLGTESDAMQLSWQQALVGEMALSQGDLAKAESGFHAAQFQLASSFSVETTLVSLGNNLPFRDGLARVMAARGQLPEAMAIYRRLNTPDITATWISLREPRFVLAVARLAARAGDQATARTEYGRFLQLWKDADEGLPELAEARAHVSQSDVVQTHGHGRRGEP
jgi:tetratricopeptide (TPR) repeat protein